MPVVAIPKPLREKLGDEAVDSLVELLNKSEEKAKEDVIALSEDKFERRLSEETTEVKAKISGLEDKFERRLSEEISKINHTISKIRVEISTLEEKFERRLSEEISKLRVELLEKISSSYTNVIKWMFIFWIGQIGTILGILFAFFKV
jgi:glycerol-3-phosphate dehydrogenase